MADEKRSRRASAGSAPTSVAARFPGTWRPAERPLLDRKADRHAIDDVLDRVRLGFSGALVLRGDHGVGKTTLLDYAIRAAVGFETSIVVGAESEVHFAFGAVHQLLIPFLPLVDDLPAPQQHAIKIAFGLSSGRAPDPFLVGLACLTLLSRAAQAHPVLGVIDDANWIDAESALVLAFVARRLYADRVGMIVALKDDGKPGAFQNLPTIDVGGLPDGAAADLLQSVAAARLDPQLVERVLADTERNPLALVEIGSDFTPEELADRAYQPEPMPIGRRLQLRYLQRVSRLPAHGREFLLLLAAEGFSDRGRVRQAAAAAHIDADAAETAAEAANLIEVSGNSIHFRHPLVRAAVYSGASDVDRRRVHLLLSTIDTSDADQDGLAWHLAAAAAEPDEHVARELERAAKRASGRGAWGTAAGLVRRSIDLTPDDAGRARREVDLAEAELVIGHPEIAQQIVDGARRRLPDAATRGRAQRIRGESLFGQGRDDEAAKILADAAGALADNPAAAMGALLSAVDASIYAGPRETEKIGRLAIPRPRPGASKPPVRQLLLAGYLARFNSGYEASVAPLHDALQRLRTEDPDPESGLRWFGMSSLAAWSLWDDEVFIDICERRVRVIRRLGALCYLPAALALRSVADCVTGRLEQAADRWAEIRELIAASPRIGMFGVDSRSEGIVHAYRGDLETALVAGRDQIRQATARGQGGLADFGRSTLVIAHLCAGEPQAAVEAALPVIEHDSPFTAEHTLPDLIEASVRSGDREAAVDAFATLDERTRAAGTAWRLGCAPAV